MRRPSRSATLRAAERRPNTEAIVPRRGSRRVSRRSRVWIRRLIVIFLAATGCSQTRTRLEPNPDPALMDDVTFLHHLRTRPVVSVDEGMRAVLLLRGSTEQWPTYKERRMELERLEAVQAAWNLHADARLDKGTLAYMVHGIAALRPSVNDRLASLTGLGDRRYALRTCIHEGLMPYGIAAEAVTGSELVALLASLESRVVPPAAAGAAVP